MAGAPPTPVAIPIFSVTSFRTAQISGRSAPWSCASSSPAPPAPWPRDRARILSSPSLVETHQLAEARVEPIRESHQDLESRVDLPSLDRTNVVPMQASAGTEAAIAGARSWQTRPSSSSRRKRPRCSMPCRYIACRSAWLRPSRSPASLYSTPSRITGLQNSRTSPLGCTSQSRATSSSRGFGS
jgi:hypothetical protein